MEKFYFFNLFVGCKFLFCDEVTDTLRSLMIEEILWVLESLFLYFLNPQIIFLNIRRLQLLLKAFIETHRIRRLSIPLRLSATIILMKIISIFVTISEFKVIRRYVNQLLDIYVSIKIELVIKVIDVVLGDFHL